MDSAKTTRRGDPFRICEGCKEPFAPRRAKQRYCCEACKLSHPPTRDRRMQPVRLFRCEACKTTFLVGREGSTVYGVSARCLRCLFVGVAIDRATRLCPACTPSEAPLECDGCPNFCEKGPKK
jgi:hypothetical protein